MKLRNRLFVLSVVTTLTLLVNLAFPIAAFADDATPPPVPTEESTSEPVATQEPSVVDNSSPNSDSGIIVPTEEVPTSEPVSTEEAVTQDNNPPLNTDPEPAPVSEVLNQLPENTTLIVLDEQGNVEPLASEAAATILETGDPIWCPGSALPGDSSCTPIKTNFTGTATNGLLRFLANNEGVYSGSGTIYVTSSLSSADTTAGAINLFADAPNLDKLTNLTIQGGWNGSTVAPSFSGQSNFGSTTLRVGTAAVPWNGSVTINDIAFSGVTSGNSLTVFTNGDSITLNNVDVINQAGNFNAGLLTSTSGDITVQGNSTFDGDASANSKGFTAETTGSITIKDTTFSEAVNPADKRNGATLTATTVKLDTVNATDNALNGIKINDATDVTLNDILASGNGSDGVKIDNSGNVTVADSIFHDNGNNGINITASGLVQLNNDTSYDNSWNGANLDLTGDVTISGGSYHDNDRRGVLAQSGGGDFLIQDAQLTGNGFAGLYAEMLSINDFTLDHVVLDGNGNYGAYLDTFGNIFVQGGSQFTDNAAAGLYIAQTNDLNIYDDITYGGSIFSNNDGHGLRAENVYGDAYIENGTFTLNSLRGLSLPSVEGSIDVISSNFLQNTGGGAYLDNSCGCTLSDITIDSSNFNENGWTGLEAYSSGDIKLNDVQANGNGNDGAFLDATYGDGDIIMTGDNTFDNNDHSGVYAYSGGNITLNNISASNNDHDGAYLDICGCVGGNITISSSIFNSNGWVSTDGRGLIAHTDGEITLNNVTASDNAGGGAELDEDATSFIGSGDITLTGTNIFNGNGFGLYPSVGLFALSTGNIDLSGVTATGNGYGDGGGAFVGADGDISITNSNFSNNCTVFCDSSFIPFDFGLLAFAGGDVTLNGVVANSNGDPINGSLGVGAIIFNGGNVFVTNSNFNDNCDSTGSCSSAGIWIMDFSGGSVYLGNVTANSNGTGSSDGVGAVIQTGGNVDIYCSTFNDNSDFGLVANIPGGNTISLNDVTISGNGGGDIDLTGGTLVVNPFDCNAVPSGSGGTSKPSVIIPITGGEKITCDAGQTSTTVKLSDGDSVILPCPINEYAVVNSNEQNALPGSLGDGLSFMSSLTALVIRDNQSIKSLDNSMVVSFAIPAGVDAKNLAILFWDGTQWQDLGGAVSADGLHFEVSTTQLGTFVLAKK